MACTPGTPPPPNCDCGADCATCIHDKGCMALEQPGPLPVPTAAELNASGLFAGFLDGARE